MSVDDQFALFGGSAASPEDLKAAEDAAFIPPPEDRPEAAGVDGAETFDPDPYSDPDQPALFEKGEWWEEHWRGMPEFVQRDLSPYKTVYVHFESREDMDAFSELVGQRLTMDTRSIWYPEATIGRLANKRYVDDNGAAGQDEVYSRERGEDNE